MLEFMVRAGTVNDLILIDGPVILASNLDTISHSIIFFH